MSFRLKLLSAWLIPESFTGIIKFPNGDKYWCLNGKYHRTDGPAMEWSDGSKHWYSNGKLHRTDGPASEFANGSKFWWLNGIPYTENQWKEKIEKPMPIL